MANRLTGIILSGSLYLFGFAYLAAPATGWHMETPSLVQKVKEWPGWAKAGAKMTLAFPFFFHSINGIRHLTWDLGIGFKNVTVMQTGWTTVGLAVLLGAYYSFVS